MASTVNNAFNEFLKNDVRLDPERTTLAKASKIWLVDQVKSLAAADKLPKLHDDVSIDFGSFSRKTKTSPLDDIDLMIIMHASGATYDSSGLNPYVNNANNAAQFKDLCYDGTSTINSIKVINKFKDQISAIPQYKKAEIKRNQEAVTLELQSYEWVFDIVPCFVTNPEWDLRTYFLIPDGKGNWKKTDPRIDKRRVTLINDQHTVSVLDMVRLCKYWNRRSTMPSMQSYLLEVMVLNYYERAGSSIAYVDLELCGVLQDIADRILYDVADPKRIQGNLNTLTWDQKIAIRERALLDSGRAKEAAALETAAKIKDSINKWREVFGDSFPSFTLSKLSV